MHVSETVGVQITLLRKETSSPSQLFLPNKRKQKLSEWRLPITPASHHNTGEETSDTKHHHHTNKPGKADLNTKALEDSSQSLPDIQAHGTP